MEQHTFEISGLLNSQFNFGHMHEKLGQETTPLELAILLGSMVHSMSSFTISDDGNSLRLEWVQQYAI